MVRRRTIPGATWLPVRRMFFKDAVYIRRYLRQLERIFVADGVLPLPHAGAVRNAVASQDI